MGAMSVTGLLFLRWVPTYGWWPLVLTGLAVAAAAAVGASQVRRYRRHTSLLRTGGPDADVLGVSLTASAVLLIGVLALYAVLALPV